MNRRALRQQFFRSFLDELMVVWPILSGLILLIVGLGIVVGVLEGWRLLDSVYFAFVTGLTIGYGDFVPHGLVPRVLAALIGATGILVTALTAAVAVKALPELSEAKQDER
jgi:hypothetical protein